MRSFAETIVHCARMARELFCRQVRHALACRALRHVGHACDCIASGLTEISNKHITTEDSLCYPAHFVVTQHHGLPMLFVLYSLDT